MTYTLRQRIIARIFGTANLEERQPEGFMEPVMFCLAHYRKHGYPPEYLICPKCREEWNHGK